MKSMLCTRQEARSDRKLLPTLSQRPRLLNIALLPGLEELLLLLLLLFSLI